MARGKRSHSHEADVIHPLERLAWVLSEDSFEDDGGAREDQWAQNVRRSLDAKLAHMRQRASTSPP